MLSTTTPPHATAGCAHCQGLTGTLLSQRINASTKYNELAVLRQLKAVERTFMALLHHNLPLPKSWGPGLVEMNLLTLSEASVLARCSERIDGNWLRKERHTLSLTIENIARAVEVHKTLIDYVEIREWPVPCTWSGPLRKLGFHTPPETCLQGYLIPSTETLTTPPFAIGDIEGEKIVVQVGTTLYFTSSETGNPLVYLCENGKPCVSMEFKKAWAYMETKDK